VVKVVDPEVNVIWKRASDPAVMLLVGTLLEFLMERVVVVAGMTVSVPVFEAAT